MLKIACDNPDCETELPWDEPDKIPFDWWLLEQRLEEQSPLPAQFVACSLPCVNALAAHEQEARTDAEV